MIANKEFEPVPRQRSATFRLLREQELALHIHRMQNNADFEMYALYAAQQAEAKRKAEETRKKLGDFASVLKSESDDVILAAGERQENQGGQREGKRGQNGKSSANPDEEDNSPRISNWA